MQDISKPEITKAAVIYVKLRGLNTEPSVHSARMVENLKDVERYAAKLSDLYCDMEYTVKVVSVRTYKPALFSGAQRVMLKDGPVVEIID